MRSAAALPGVGGSDVAPASDPTGSAVTAKGAAVGAATGDAGNAEPAGGGSRGDRGSGPSAAIARNTGSARISAAETNCDALALAKHPRLCLSITYTLRLRFSTIRAGIQTPCDFDQ